MTNYMEQQPVRRGRPRASYAEMGEFDLSLIREFRSRPELYDRNSPLFKDKVLSAQRWQEISNKLGFAVALLKDRMLQLRNRYNIEKRRIEQIREENPHIVDTEASPWPLFEHLQFLSDHIRPRRSYKRLVPNVSGYEQEDDYRNEEDNDDSRKHSYSSTEMTAPYFANVEVKEEHESDQQTDDECDSTEDAEVLSPAHMLPPQNHNSAHSPEKTALTALPTSITIRQLDSMRDGITQRISNPYAPKLTSSTYSQKQQQQQQQQQHHQQQQQQNHQQQQQQQQQHQQQQHHQQQMQHQQQQHQSQMRHQAIQQQYNKRPHYDHQHHNRYHQNSSHSIIPAKRLQLDVRGHKYTAFGYFLSSLLEELPQDKALELVQKFTSDLVQVARSSNAKGNTENGTVSNIETIDSSGSLGVGGGGSNVGIAAGLAVSVVNDEEGRSSTLLGM